MSAELKLAQDRILNLQNQAQIDREIRAAQHSMDRVFKLKLPRFFKLSRKHV